MIKTIVTGDREVAAHLDRVDGQVRGKLRASIARLIVQLQRNVMQGKLSGQVLKVRTGTLRRSIDQRVQEGAAGIAGTVWTNLSYAPRHEFGFTGAESVKEHLRMCKQAFGRPLKEPRQITVRAHTRSVNYPPHSFLRTTLYEMGPEIIQALRVAVGEGIH